MSHLVVGALTLGSGTVVLFGLRSIYRGLICESSIDAPSMDAPSIDAPSMDAPSMPDAKAGSSSNGRRFNHQASSAPTLE
jgi:hypothetical protein